MKEVHIFLFIVILFTLSQKNIYAQQNCPCCTEHHDQFDFWLGDWVVYDTLGNLLGENHVLELENNCLINENWKGAKGSTGKSYNYYNPQDSTWNQLWVASNGNILNLKGRWNGRSMALFSDLAKSQQGNLYFNRISWTPLDDGTVEQKWDILDPDRKLRQTIFLGIYKKK